MNSNLSYMLSRVQAVSTQSFRLQPQNSTSASPGQQIRISLPSNTLLNTRSCKLLFNVTTTGQARLPAKIDSLIDRVTLEAGGVTIDGGNLNNYGVLRHAKDALMGSKTDSVLGHPEMVRAKPYHNGAIAYSESECLRRKGGKATDSRAGRSASKDSCGVRPRIFDRSRSDLRVQGQKARVHCNRARSERFVGR